MFGPPGTGKTMTAKAVAKKMKFKDVFVLDPTHVTSKWCGVAEKAVKIAFQLVRTFIKTIC